MDKKPDVRSPLADRLMDEGLCSVTKAASDIGVSISSKTALRWCLNGARGVRLESLKVGGRRMTSRAAMRRFIAAIQDKPVVTDEHSAGASSTPVIMSRDEADCVLAAFGLGRAPKA